MTEERSTFGSKIGGVLAAAGSAVGLGNIWRFPYEAGNDGGAAFILVYLACILFFGIPVMIAEFSIGRHSRANTAKAYRILAPGTAWKWVGRWGVLTGFCILGYYTVVAGWTLQYIYEAATNSFIGKTPDQFISSFNEFTADPILPAMWMIVFMVGTHFVITRGVQRGIEQSAKLLMPILFILLIVLAVCSVLLPNGEKGVEFLLKPDFSKIDSSVLLGATGQTFYSLSLGMGCLCTYASYFRGDVNITQTALNVATIDTLVAILAGFIIFPAAFSVGINPDAGASLIFITLPNVFAQAFGNSAVMAVSLSVLFYVLLALAALTSTISMHEVVTVYLHEEFQMTRKKAAILVTTVCSVIGLMCSLSLGVWKEFTIFGLTLFDAFDFVTAKLMLPVGGFFISIFTGWYLNHRVIAAEIAGNGTPHFIVKIIIFILRFVAPVGIAFVFLNELGFLNLLQ